MNASTSDSGTSLLPVNILLVDDHPANLQVLEVVLEDLGQNLVKAGSGNEALRCVMRSDFAVILLDVQMQDMDGFETAELIRKHRRSRHTPIIFLTAFESNRLPIDEAYALGAVDYLVKPVVPKILRSKVHTFVDLFQKSERIKLQEAQLRALERQAFEQAMADERQRWELEAHRAEAAREKEISAAMAQKAEELHALSCELRAEVGERRRVEEQLRQSLAEQQRAEEERRQLQARIQHTQKLESLGVLAGGIAHDFNNLLTGVLGNASLALLEVPPGDNVHGLLQQIEKAALRAAELTTQMLAYSGKGRFVIQSLDLSQLVEEMASLLQTVVSKKAQLRLDFAPHLPAVKADPTQLRQVVMNLITNASDALGDHSGTISLRTGVVAADRAYLTSAHLQEDLAEGDYVFLEVRDDGCGMDAGTAARIFDPFFTTKFTGRGLGLAAVLGIVRGHRGTIKVVSEPGEGTTFQVLLPCAGRPRPLPPPPPPADVRWRGHGTVLVVDDEDAVRALARMALETAGFAVLSADDGRAALDLADRHGPALAAVLLDLTMPHLGGGEVFRELKQKHPDVPVVLMSGYTEDEVARHLPASDNVAFLQKPFRVADLLRVLRQAVESAPKPVCACR